MPKQTVFKGDLFETTKFGTVQVIRYYSAIKIRIKFLITGFKTFTTAQLLRIGKIRDLYFPIHFGVGYIGEGPIKAHVDSTSNKQTKLYTIWRNMLKRCYTDEFPSYAGCTVVKRWHNLQVFCEDIMKMPNWNAPGFELDKDLRVPGNKIYGPKYCSFVPKKLNNALGSRRGYRVVKDSGKYYAQVSINGKTKWSTASNTEEDAKIKYENMKKEAMILCASLYKSDIHPQVYRSLTNGSAAFSRF